MSGEIKQKRSIGGYLKLVWIGFAMGVANVIPGVSGGTMAFILGIYEELIDSIRKFASVDTIRKGLCFKIKELFKELPWEFLASLAIGVVLAFATASKLFTWLLAEKPVLTFAFFFGLVAASILTVLKKVKKWNFSRILMLAIGAVVAFLLVQIVPVSTPNIWWLSFICGMIVICAMILPGISGSFLLLVLGQYKYVWGAVAALASMKISAAAISTLVFVGAGCIVGISSFVHLLNWLFKKFHDLTVATLIGFMIGSMWKLWPWKVITLYSVKAGKELKPNLDMTVSGAGAELEKYKEAGAKLKPLVEQNFIPKDFDGQFWSAIGLVVLGLIIVLVMEYIANRKDNTDLDSNSEATEK